MSSGKPNQYPANPVAAAEPVHDVISRPRWLLDEKSSPEEIAILRAMTGQQRLTVAAQMFWMARELKAAGVLFQHPEWSEADVTAEVNRIFLHAAE